MAFDGITISNIVHDLNNTILGGRLYKIAQPESDELLLTIKTGQGQFRVVLSSNASLPLAYITDDNKPSPATAPNFVMLLRKHINNGRIISITQPSFERIIDIEIEHLDELGDLCRRHLITEFMGKHSNIILCDDKNNILDSIKHVSAQMSSVREVLPGREYFIPDTMQKVDPLTVTSEEFAAHLTGKPMPLAKAIYTSFTGISPVTAEEICFLAGMDSSIPAQEYSADILLHLYTQFEIYLSVIKEDSFSPGIYFDGKSQKNSLLFH